jgi:nitroreductase/FMN reductase [NAD(P)H]
LKHQKRAPIHKVEQQLAIALEQRYGEPVKVTPGLADLDSLLRIAAQSSHRRWAATPVLPELTRLLAACALAAPTKSYLQQTDIIDVRDAGKRAALAALTPGMPWLADAPALLVFCANGRRFKHLFERADVPFTNDHLDGFFNPTVDASLVMMNFINAAGAAGLVGCAISMLRNHAERLAQILELPQRVVPVAGLCLGYPTADALEHPAVNPRLPLRATFHTDRMGDADDDAATDAFDARYIAARAARSGGSAPARAWSAERVHQYATPQRDGWGRFVRAQGFDLR